MSIIFGQVIKYCAIRSLNRNFIKIPLNTIVQKRQISILSPAHVQNEEKNTSTDKKSKDAVKITLLGPNNSIQVVSLEDAKHLSRRRDLELVKIQDFDTKTERPVYKLLTKAELIAQEVAELEGTQGTQDEDVKKSSTKRVEKNLTINSKISDHDLSTRLKNLSKWLSKGYEVRIIIQGVYDAAIGDKIFNQFENLVKENNSGRIVQKRIKNGNIKFNILPSVKKES